MARAGTPEFMTLVWKFVKKGYAVVAMGARRGGDQWRCYETRWPPEEWQELPGVRPPHPPPPPGTVPTASELQAGPW